MIYMVSAKNNKMNKTYVQYLELENISDITLRKIKEANEKAEEYEK